ncbi:hypothetical protein MNBD_GAMMA22-3137 [hydrothermal vent metagenome]|uniref:Uncharacterized protein n=1 Tax=hydrothermal vent metagenome TaxID=652676 RepID=A0A3B1ASY5_9ZZZZ
MFNKISKALRLFFLIIAITIALGIYLTGYTTVHWVLYLPLVFMLFASITGICPGIIVSKMIVGEK